MIDLIIFDTSQLFDIVAAIMGHAEYMLERSIVSGKNPQVDLASDRCNQWINKNRWKQAHVHGTIYVDITSR